MEAKAVFPFKLEDFDMPPIITRWIEDNFQPPLILVGESGSGKTQLGKTLATVYGWNMLTVNHLQGLKELTSSHDAILFDDFSTQDMTEALWLAITDTSRDRDIRLLRASVTKRQSLTHIFTFNVEAFKKVAYRFKRKKFAKRCRVTQLPSNFIINMNLVNNIQINNYNHIYNNLEAIKANKQAVMDIRNSKKKITLRGKVC